MCAENQSKKLWISYPDNDNRSKYFKTRYPSCTHMYCSWSLNAQACKAED
jgi:hypothetical protein